MVAGATGIDLFLLVIDAAEGARPQTHEHLAILRLLGIDRGVVAVTKSDAVDEETLELALAEAARARARGRGGRGQREDGRRTGRAAGRPRPGSRRRRTRACRRRRAPLRRPRLHAARNRDGRDRHALVGDGRRRGRAAGRAARPRRARAQRAGARPRGRAGGGRAARRRRASGRRARADRARGRAGRAWSVPGHVPAGRDARGARGRPGRRHRPPRHRRRPGAGGARATATSSCGWSGRSSPPRGDRVVLRTRSTVGGGVVLDPRPPRRLDPERLGRIERGESGRDRVRARSAPRR